MIYSHIQDMAAWWMGCQKSKAIDQRARKNLDDKQHECLLDSTIPAELVFDDEIPKEHMLAKIQTADVQGVCVSSRCRTKRLEIVNPLTPEPLSAILPLPTCCVKHPSHGLANALPQSRCLSLEDKTQIAAFLEICASPHWQHVSNLFGSATTKKFSMFKQGSNIKMIKGTCPLPCSPAQFFGDFCCLGKWAEMMHVADVMFLDGKVVRELDPHHFICHGQFKAPPPVTNREFVWKDLHCMTDEHTVISIGWSIPWHDIPIPSNFVRGEILVSGYMTRQIVDGYELIYIVQVDPKGWLPTWVANLVAADQAEKIWV